MPVVTRASSTTTETTEMEKMQQDMMEMVQQMQKKIDDHMVETRASDTTSEMEKMQQEITEMIQQLVKKMDDAETNIMNSIDNKCNVLEDNIKHYTNSVVFAYIDNIIKHTTGAQKDANIVINDQTRSRTEHKTQSNANLNNSVASETINTNNKNGDVLLTGLEPARLAGETINTNPEDSEDLLTGLEPAFTMPKLPIHDVYIGGTNPTTTEDNLNKYLIKIGVPAQTIMSVTCISGNDPKESSFRVKICDTSVRDTIYNSTNFKAGITVMPFRIYLRNTNQNTTRHDKRQPTRRASTSDEGNDRHNERLQSHQTSNRRRKFDSTQSHTPYNRSHEHSWRSNESNLQEHKYQSRDHSNRHEKHYQTRSQNNRHETQHKSRDYSDNRDRQYQSRDHSNRYERQHQSRDYSNHHDRHYEPCDYSNSHNRLYQSRGCRERYDRQHSLHDTNVRYQSHRNEDESLKYNDTNQHRCPQDAYWSQPQPTRPHLNVYAAPYTPQQQPLYLNQWATGVLPTIGVPSTSNVSNQQQTQTGTTSNVNQASSQQ